MEARGQTNFRVLRPVIDCQANRLEAWDQTELETVANVLRLAVESGLLPNRGSNQPFGLKYLAAETVKGASDILAGEYPAVHLDAECHDIGRAGVRMFIRLRLRRANYTLTLAYNIAPLANEAR